MMIAALSGRKWAEGLAESEQAARRLTRLPRRAEIGALVVTTLPRFAGAFSLPE